MVIHAFDFAKKWWRAVRPDVSGRGPTFLMSAGALTLVGWASAVYSQPATSRHRVVSGFSILFLVIFLLGFCLWLAKNVQRYSAQGESVTLDDLSKKLDLVIQSVTIDNKLVVADKSNPNGPRTVLGKMVVPVGGFVATALGVGPVAVTVPSGQQFGADPSKPFTFTLPQGPQTIRLADGGTVTSFEFRSKAMENFGTPESPLSRFIGGTDDDEPDDH